MGSLTNIPTDLQTLLPLEQLNGQLSNGLPGQVLVADKNGNASWGTSASSLAVPGTPTVPARSYGVAYLPSATRPTWVGVTLFLQANTGGQQPENRFYIGPSAASVLTPFTGGLQVGRSFLQNNASGAFALQHVTTLVALIPAGWYYSIINTADPAGANGLQTVLETTL